MYRPPGADCRALTVCEDLPQISGQRPESLAPVGDRVLLLEGELSRGPRVTFDHQDRVVAEAVVAARLPGHRTRHTTFADQNRPIRQGEDCGAHERRAAVLVRDVVELAQQQLEVGPILAPGSRPAST